MLSNPKSNVLCIVEYVSQLDLYDCTSRSERTACCWMGFPTAFQCRPNYVGGSVELAHTLCYRSQSFAWRREFEGWPVKPANKAPRVFSEPIR